MKNRVFLLCLLLIIMSLQSTGQTSFPYFIRVYFSDKGTENFQPEDLLSKRAIERRQKAGIQFPVYSDLPVKQQYIDKISSLGYTFHCSSKWMNTALFKSSEITGISILRNLPFVSDLKIVKTPLNTKSSFVDKLDVRTTGLGLFPYDRPITMLNGNILHDKGFKGENILIAVLDGGFFDADRIDALKSLRQRNGIISTRDYVELDDEVYESSSHGTAVMSILAGQVPGRIAGTAPSADYMLFKTEDVYSEYPCEEDFWAAAAEFADSSGADIISSSLGYNQFDDPSMNYKQPDLDGNTSFITNIADIAASKGILVVVSAGNERDNSWRKIIFPSDGDSVIAAGAVDENTKIAIFSSAGPSADRRVKPDNVAMGVAVPLQVTPGSTTTGNGTSFSCPVLSGMSACLMQAFPGATNTQIIGSLHLSGDRFNSPDSLYGYGIPDMAKAYDLLFDMFVKLPDKDMIVSPNPTTGMFRLIFKQAPGPITVSIYSTAGKTIFRKYFPAFMNRSLEITDLLSLAGGMYLIEVRKAEGTITARLIKTR